MAGYAAVRCHLRRVVGQRCHASYECEEHHHWNVEISEELRHAGFDTVKAAHGEVTCPRCGKQGRVYGLGCTDVYDTEDGELHPGDMFFAPWSHHSGKCFAGWTNCDGRHLHVVLPNGATWNIDGRASNCTLPNDTEHRCWVRHGEPPNITVDKAGHTCAAGAGSILSGDYHGFLRNGWLTAG